MIGRTLGHYVILERLGAGGMGVVYRARDERLRREVALKLLPADDAAAPEARARLLREARTASSLNHPHVCTVHEVDEDAGQVFIAMELVAGRTLSAVIGPGGLAPREVLRLGVEIAGAVAHAHEHGILHRDLKSGNVMVTDDGRAKVLDFGLARAVASDDAATVTGSERLTHTGAVMGTTPYMAPEVLRGEGASERSDVWALGILLYEMTCGTLPFDGHTHFEIASKVLNSEPAELPESVPSGLRGVIRHCLQQQPGMRYSNAGEVRVALETLVAERAPAPELPVPAASRPPPAPAARSRMRIGVGAAALAAVAAILIFSPHQGCPKAARVIRTLAVLPLVSLSAEPEQEYFVDGMTDELINQLARIASIRVIARRSMMAYKGTHKSVAQIAKELGADLLVDGSVSRGGDRVRVRVELANATGQNVWTDSYERELRDVLVLQADVARAIVERISAQLTPAERQGIASAKPVDPRAYEEYLRGRYNWDAYTVAAFLEARDHFQRALQFDSTYAPAWAGLADAEYGLSNMFSPPDSAIPRARVAAQRALALDPDLAEGHTSLGITQMVYDWNWAGAEESFRRAIRLRPNDANAHWWLGHLLILTGKSEQGLVESRKALELDPNSQWYQVSVGWHLRLAGRLDEALVYLREAARRHPESSLFHHGYGQALLQAGDVAGALTEIEMAYATGPEGIRTGLAHVYGAAGRTSDARRLIAELMNRRKRQYTPATELATAYAGLQDREQTLHWLEAGFQERSEHLMFLKVDPIWNFLRDEPRFIALQRKVGLGS